MDRDRTGTDGQGRARTKTGTDGARCPACGMPVPAGQACDCDGEPLRGVVAGDELRPVETGGQDAGREGLGRELTDGEQVCAERWLVGYLLAELWQALDDLADTEEWSGDDAAVWDAINRHGTIRGILAGAFEGDATTPQGRGLDGDDGNSTERAG